MMMVANCHRQWMRGLAADEVEKEEEEVVSEFDLEEEVGELESA